MIPNIKIERFICGRLFGWILLCFLVLGTYILDAWSWFLLAFIAFIVLFLLYKTISPLRTFVISHRGKASFYVLVGLIFAVLYILFYNSLTKYPG